MWQRILSQRPKSFLPHPLCKSKRENDLIKLSNYVVVLYSGLKNHHYGWNANKVKFNSLHRLPLTQIPRSSICYICFLSEDQGKYAVWNLVRVSILLQAHELIGMIYTSYSIRRPLKQDEVISFHSSPN